AEPETEAPLGNGVRLTGRNEQDKRLKFTTNVGSAPLDLFSNVELNFEQPLESLDTTLINLYTDSAYIPFTNIKTTLDTSRKKLSLAANWQPGTSYHLILQEDFAADTSGFKLLRADTLNFTARQLSDYGSLNIRLRNLETYTNPVLQFVLNDKVV